VKRHVIPKKPCCFPEKHGHFSGKPGNPGPYRDYSGGTPEWGVPWVGCMFPDVKSHRTDVSPGRKTALLFDLAYSSPYGQSTSPANIAKYDLIRSLRRLPGNSSPVPHFLKIMTSKIRGRGKRGTTGLAAGSGVPEFPREFSRAGYGLRVRPTIRKDPAVKEPELEE
jgi:hypothetical protein